MRRSDDTLEKLSRQVDAMMDELMGNSLYRLVSSDAWEPQINIYEVKDRYWVCVDLAGMSPSDIEVSTEGDVLTISGVRERPDPPEGMESQSIHVMEIDSGRFEREIELPSSVDRSGIVAQYRGGFLWICLPKKS